MTNSRKWPDGTLKLLLLTIMLICASPCVSWADRVDDLILALKSNDVARRADAAQALAKQKSRRAIPALLVAMGDSVESVRLQALRAAADTIAVYRDDLAMAASTLTDTNANRRAGAAQLLGIFPDKRNVKALTRATHDLNAQVRAACVHRPRDLGCIAAVVDATAIFLFILFDLYRLCSRAR